MLAQRRRHWQCQRIACICEYVVFCCSCSIFFASDVEGTPKEKVEGCKESRGACRHRLGAKNEWDHGHLLRGARQRCNWVHASSWAWRCNSNLCRAPAEPIKLCHSHSEEQVERQAVEEAAGNLQLARQGPAATALG